MVSHFSVFILSWIIIHRVKKKGGARVVVLVNVNWQRTNAFKWKPMKSTRDKTFHDTEQ